jgi:PhnB protein
MTQLNIPEGLQTVMPYLILPGAQLFLDFVKDVFEAVETHKTMGEESGIRHAQVKIGDSTIMFSDSTDEFKPMTAGMFIYVRNADETYNKALEKGATSIMPPADQDYGRSCGVKDPVGNTWWITSVPL